jgi:hypothetical protein
VYLDSQNLKLIWKYCGIYENHKKFNVDLVKITTSCIEYEVLGVSFKIIKLSSIIFKFNFNDFIIPNAKTKEWTIQKN